MGNAEENPIKTGFFVATTRTRTWAIGKFEATPREIGFFLRTKHMTKTQYKTLLEKHPDLTAHGYGVQSDPHLGSTRDERFNNMRPSMFA